MVIVFIVFLLSIYLLKLNRDRLLEVEIPNSDEETIIYEKHFALILEESYDLSQKTIYEGAKQKGEELSIYVENFGDYLPVSYTIKDKLKMAIASNVDGIILHADPDEEVHNQIKEATLKGIPVVTVLDDLPLSGRISYIGVNQHQLGKYYGNQIHEIIKDNNNTFTNIKILIDNKDNSPEILLSGIKESLHMGNLKIDLIPIDRQSAFSSEETMHDIILEQEDFAVIIVCLNATDTISAYQTIIDYNMVGQVEVIGYYDLDIILEAIDKDIIDSTIVIDTKQLGELSVETLNEYILSGMASEYIPVDISIVD